MEKEFQVNGNGAIQPANGIFVDVIERLASNPDVDPVKLEKFMDLQERILDRNAEQAFNSDMVACQSEIKMVIAKHENKQTSSKYAKDEDIDREIKPIYTKHGFALSFYEGETKKENHVRIMVDVMHREGHTKIRFKDFPIDDKGIQGKVNKTPIHADQSAFTYGKRNLTRLIFNIPIGEDDDGNAAGGLEYINTDQQTEINDLITELYGTNQKLIEKCLSFMKIESVDKMPAKDYQKHLNGLKNLREGKR